MTIFSLPTPVVCLAILLLGIGCGGKTHVVGSAADGSAGGAGGGSGGTAGLGGAQGSGGLTGQDGPTALGGATSMGGATATGGATGGGGVGGTMPKDAPVATGDARGTGGAIGSGGRTGASGGKSGAGVASGGRFGTGGADGGSSGTGGEGGRGGTSGSTGSSVDGGGGVIECEQRGGQCQSVPLTANAYAWCVSLSGNCLLPTSVHEGALGCAAGADGVMPVCCLPWWDQPQSQCVGGGMACYPTTTPSGTPIDHEDMCPMGWSISNAVCGEAGTDCCGPPVAGPVCEPWP
ncbi:MAG: hypothetical protein JXP73_12965 [Deltaproteobacteria bacterium]|nr:hypothetical protein [Deltaproteobacteria bacterium]